MDKKVIFILNSIQAQRCIKRIEEFIDNGYSVEVYGFKRNIVQHTISDKFKINIIGEINNSSPYLQRINIILHGVKSVFQLHNNEDGLLYYYFGIDIALCASWMKQQIYIYEESDLVHTYLTNNILKNIFEYLDKRIIKKSLLTVFTSKGFYHYHFGDKNLDNILILTNRLNKKIINLPLITKDIPMLSNLKIGFVGDVRYNSVLSFSKIFISTFPQHEFHFFGNPESLLTEFEKLKEYPNVFFHGKFINPQDLPSIYSQIDLVLSTYDVEFENVRYAEPNKLYEAIYFRTPIIVSKGTFLSEKVDRLNIGYSIDPLNREEIVRFINGLTTESILQKINSLTDIPCEVAIDENKEFFEKIREKISLHK